jgi:hypothetical protein
VHDIRSLRHLLLTQQTRDVLKSHQAREFAEYSLKSCDSCNLIGLARILAAVPGNCAESLQTLSMHGGDAIHPALRIRGAGL